MTLKRRKPTCRIGVERLPEMEGNTSTLPLWSEGKEAWESTMLFVLEHQRLRIVSVELWISAVVDQCWERMS